MLGRQASKTPTLVSTTFHVARGIRLPTGCGVSEMPGNFVSRKLTGKVQLTLRLHKRHHAEGGNDGNAAKIVSDLDN